MENGQEVLIPTYARLPVAFARGKGAWVWDKEGRAYLDFVSGLGVNALGHCHPRVVAAVKRQAEELMHCSNLYGIPLQVELAARLTAIFGGGKAFFVNSGTEANETALKLARKYFYRRGEKCYEIIAAENSFHGRTLGALAATGQKKFHLGFEPLPAGFKFVPFNDLGVLKEAITPWTAAVILEAVQGEGGIHVASGAYLEGVAELCRKEGILLILDEVQCGFGRTGSFFAYEESGVQPDIVTLAKALGGGVPLAAVLARTEVANAFQPGDHGCTFGGNPLACAAGLAALEVLFEEGICANAREVGDYFRAGLQSLALRYPYVKEVRGKGLMLGMELTFPGQPLVEACLAKGLLINCTSQKVLRFLPPLIIGREEIDRALEILAEVLATVEE